MRRIFTQMAAMVHMQGSSLVYSVAPRRSPRGFDGPQTERINTIRTVREVVTLSRVHQCRRRGNSSLIIKLRPAGTGGVT